PLAHDAVLCDARRRRAPGHAVSGEERPGGGRPFPLDSGGLHSILRFLGPGSHRAAGLRAEGLARLRADEARGRPRLPIRRSGRGGKSARGPALRFRGASPREGVPPAGAAPPERAPRERPCDPRVLDVLHGGGSRPVQGREGDAPHEGRESRPPNHPGRRTDFAPAAPDPVGPQPAHHDGGPAEAVRGSPRDSGFGQPVSSGRRPEDRPGRRPLRSPAPDHPQPRRDVGRGARRVHALRVQHGGDPPPGGSWRPGRRRTGSRWKSRSTGCRTTRSWSDTRRCTDAGRRSADTHRPETLRFIARISDSISNRMTVLGVDTIAIVVSDPRKAIEWYRDVLGLDVAYIGPNEPNPDPSVQGTVENPGHWVELGPARPRTRVHLCFMRGETEPGPSGITFISDDIQADYERMRRQGVEFPLPPEKMEWGEWLGQFADLDGNVFDLKQPISAAEWKAGSPPAKPRKARRVR